MTQTEEEHLGGDPKGNTFADKQIDEFIKDLYHQQEGDDKETEEERTGSCFY